MAHGRGIPDLQERIEATEWGRAAISVVIAVTLVTLLVIQLPDSELKRQATRLTGPYALATGLDQNWGVFAPDPRREVIDLQAEVFYSDGSSRAWRVPTGDDFIGAYWDYRWLKFMEAVVRDDRRDLWPPLARWIARQDRAGRQPVGARLIRRTAELRPPGASPDREPFMETTLYRVRRDTRSGAAGRAR